MTFMKKRDWKFSTQTYFNLRSGTFPLLYLLVTVNTGKSLSGVVIFEGRFSVVQFVVDKTRNEMKYVFSGHCSYQCGGSKGGCELPVLAVY